MRPVLRIGIVALRNRWHILRILTMGFLLLVASGFCSSIEVKDTLKVNTTWNADTVRVTDTLFVASGVMLTITPGTRVIVSMAIPIFAKGGISAKGTVQDSIVFTAADTGAAWGGVRLGEGPASPDNIFEYCRFSYVKGEFLYGALRGFQDTKLSVMHSLFERNEGYYGGALYLAGATNYIGESVFRNNTARGGGGAIYISNGTLANNLIEDNREFRYGGGGIAVYANGKPFIISNIIRRNVSAYQGGGLYSDRASPTMINNLIVENVAVDGGGLAFCNFTDVGGGTSGLVVNNTIAKNRSGPGGRGGGVYVDNTSDANFINSILSANQSTAGESDFFQPNWNSAFTSTVNGRADIFVDADQGDFHLKQGSSPITIDAGYPDTTRLQLPAVDLDGKPRISGKRIDIGAYEFQSGSAVRFPGSAQTFTPGFAREGGNLRLLLPGDVAGVVLVRLRDTRGRVALETREGDRGVVVLDKSLPAGAYGMDFDFLSRGRRSSFSAMVTLP